MNFLNLINTARCSANNSNSEELRTPEAIPVMMRDVLLNETGRDRIRRMYSTNEYGFSPEMLSVIQTGSASVFLGGIFGGIKAMNAARDDFLRRNIATTYESQHRARRSLTDTMTLAAFNGAWKNALKYGSFTTIYLLGTMSVANYRNEVSIWEHFACGALIGGLSRCNYGVKGILVAGGLGGFLGFIAGGVITLSMRLTGTTLEQLRYIQHEDHYARILRERKKRQQKNDKTEEWH